MQSQASGQCGTLCEWQFTPETGTLRISGDMWSWPRDGEESPGWSQYAESITAIEFSDVQTIGSYAFKGCTALTSVEIPKGVTNLGAHAFDGCYQLRDVSLTHFQQVEKYKEAFPADTVQSITFDCRIGERKFSGCAGLVSVTIKKNSEYIGTSAFYGCPDLKKVECKGDLASIGVDAFSSCPNLEVFIYGGMKPPNSQGSPFKDCPKLGKIEVPQSYQDFKFCGMPTTKEVPTKEPEPSDWFADNIAWLAPTGSILLTMAGLLFKYKEIIQFYENHCKKKDDNNNSSASVQYNSFQDI